ncbi:M48 family peptidase [bacterium CG_4_10_14_0_2_um_filter_33_32]|nr:MAG: hypothetical protein AUJ93_01660 [bacterium CG2_30_33_46]PIR67838.1 MAG: M48 family peptidase [bacterium CG10_big_fil_rev_8_21_14_0_10_33_18]PIU76484.1 MAG: M48 family peptidase [bacterium CG06_land_8_20_14_3_00_33_50]PIW81359.1 MAG: M48 family peptidase [bacterium CG_4_8_14_3_um_filter_33_28]PIY85188.1 MAG: M48 family peptidase [bacterium CG_4_10_14_0_8_um_filter_33_57]PIZ86312.1 MAG: M48 family peptidase [bacterium CG_4_10_14_0_2_um_filter_33_32]PJA72288.1 MAG: M48 family peptidase 
MSLISYNIIYSKRKTVALIIETDGTLSIRAPRRLGVEKIKAIVKQKKNWILKKVKEKEKRKRFIPKQFTEGEKFLYLGREYELNFVDARLRNVIFQDEFIVPVLKPAVLKKMLEKWYIARAKQVIQERVKVYSDKIGVIFSKLRFSKAKSRWGSCSSKKTLSFNWRLIMAPLEIIDYVVIHELVHILEMNHSKKFWKKMEEFSPGCKRSKKWLKDYGYLLNI